MSENLEIANSIKTGEFNTNYHDVGVITSYSIHYTKLYEF